MNTVVTGSYDSTDKLRNAREDLIASGIPLEKLHQTEPGQIKVMIPAVSEAEIIEIFQRHDPDSVEVE